MPNISELPVKTSPSASAVVAGVDVNEEGNLESVQIPFSALGAYKSYSYNVEHVGRNMFELITDLKHKGYTAGEVSQPMVLTLSGALGSRIFVGYIHSFAGDTACNFELLDCARCIKYSQTAEGISTTTLISDALNNATITEFGGSTYDFLHFTVDSGSTSYLIDLKLTISKVVDDISKPTFVKLVGRNTRTVLIWFSMMGDDIGSVYCWDLVSRKYYYAEALTLPAVRIEDFFSAYEVEQESGGSPMTSITYDELKALRDSGSLVAGMFYRITDYRCTTAQDYTGAMANQFDIIVQALDESTLSETASADKHENDTYFANSNLSAWELKYCLDNDTTRFAWALEGQAITNLISGFSNGEPLTRKSDFDGRLEEVLGEPTEYYYAWGIQADADEGDSANFIYSKNETITNGEIVYNAGDGGEQTAEVIEGKGVVYYMKDEFGNECPYDFKNITYKGNSLYEYEAVGLDANTYYPTFTHTSLNSYSQWGSTWGVSRNSSLDTTVGGVAYYGYTCSATPMAWSTADFYITDAVISSSSIMYSIDGGTVSQISFGGSLSVRSSLDSSVNGGVTTCIIKPKYVGEQALLADNVFVGGGHSNIQLGANCFHNIFLASCQDIVYEGGNGNNLIRKSCYGIYLELVVSNYDIGEYSSQLRVENSQSLGRFDSSIIPERSSGFIISNALKALEARIAALEGNS